MSAPHFGILKLRTEQRNRSCNVGVYKPQLNEKNPAKSGVLKEMLQRQAEEDTTAEVAESRIVESRKRNLEDSAQDLSIKKVRITKCL